MVHFKNIVAKSIFFACLAPLFSHAYYGAHATETILEYAAYADLPIWGNPTVEELNDKDSSVRSRVLIQLDTQIQHLMGHFQSMNYLNQYNFKGVLGESYKIHFTKVEPGSTPGRNKVYYRYRGKIILKKEVFARVSERDDLPIVLPLQPDYIYSQSYDEVEDFYPCTDHHYQTEGDFWYFWDPANDNCTLNDRPELLVQTKGHITEVPNTTSTYPEYDELYTKEENTPLKVAVHLGYINDINNLKWPNRHDDAWKAYRQLEAYLEGLGYEKVETKGPFREDSLGRVTEGQGTGINYWDKYRKENVRTRYGRITIEVEILIGDTAIASKDWTFSRHWKNAVETADIIVYDGHSGLGANLDLSLLPEPIEFNEKYQIIYFNGCSSYPYFRGMYERAKVGGSKKLDILTSGLPTYSDTIAPNMQAFLDPFLQGHLTSWQRILGGVDKSNGENGTYLTGVSGDQDNQWRPQ